MSSPDSHSALESRAAQLHADSLVINALDISIFDRDLLESMVSGGVNAVNICAAVYQDFSETIERLADLKARVAQYADLAAEVRTVQDLRRGQQSGTVGIIWGFQNTTPFEGDLRLVQTFAELGVRIVQLTYMTANLVGDGCLEPRNGGLTLYGREMIRTLNREGILIDLSHCGERTTLEAIECSDGPVAVTHACARALCASPRNKTDSVMRALTERGGVMGITSLASFVADDWRDANLERYLDHIDHAVEVMGAEHVGLGMDFTAGQPLDFVRPPKWGGSQVPPDPHDQGPPLSTWPIPYATGAADHAELPAITEGLVARGHSESVIEGILGGNFERLFGEVWNG
jgi:membrane dipeptidase